jgi:hypothetical protein
MAFCNACGATLDANAKFCPKCGKATMAAATTTPAAAPKPVATAPATTSSNGLKTILIVFAVIVALGIVGTMAATFIGLSIARRTKVTERDGKVKVETPFGAVVSSEDPEDAAKNLGVDIYPGAKPMKGESANVAVGGMHTVSVEMVSDDSPDKVAEFYRAKFPGANVSVTDEGETTIVSTGKKGIVTINIEPQGDKTHIHIANVNNQSSKSSDSSN